MRRRDNPAGPAVPSGTLFGRLTAGGERNFLDTLRAEKTGGALLLVGAVVALIWASSPWRESYEAMRTTVVGPSALGYLGLGRDELRLDATEPSTVMLIGGEPFVEPLLMWWNYVARTRDEVAEAHRAWNAGDDRFGRVASSLERISTAYPPWA